MSDQAVKVDYGRFVGVVTDAGGGAVSLLVERDTEEYPPLNAKVVVTWEVEPRA